MLINIAIGCQPDYISGCSECGVLLSALQFHRATLEHDRQRNSPTTQRMLDQIDGLIELVYDAMLSALESLETVQQPDGKGGYKTVYEFRRPDGGGRNG